MLTRLHYFLCLVFSRCFFLVRPFVIHAAILKITFMPLRLLGVRISVNLEKKIFFQILPTSEIKERKRWKNLKEPPRNPFVLSFL